MADTYIIKARRRKGARWESVGAARDPKEGKAKARTFLENCSGYLEAYLENGRTGHKVRNSLQAQILTIREDDA